MRPLPFFMAHFVEFFNTSLLVRPINAIFVLSTITLQEMICKKRLLAMGIGTMMATLTQAAPVDLQQALQIAQQVLPGKSWQAASSATRRAPGGQQATYYLLNASDSKGYVIVAGDDRVPPVLGYSDQGTLSGDLPEALQQWLDG